MAADYNDLQQKTDANREAVVDHEEARKQGIPPAAGRPIRGIDWTSILAKHGLESPGYKETIEKMKREGKIK